MKIGEVVQELRKSAGLSQAKLAKSCKISQTYLSQIEKDRREPRLSTLDLIAKELKIPVQVLIFLSLDKNQIPAKKQKAFELIFPSIRAFIKELFKV